MSDSIEDCKLGFGYNANLNISAIYERSPWYLQHIYETEKDLSEDVKRVIMQYIKIEKENEPMAKAKDTQQNQSENPITDLTLLEKINAIRNSWSNTEIEKEGKGKAGGGAKYDYYKPQQIINFCLKEELKHNIFSEFRIKEDGFCSYNLIDIKTGETRSVECPFEVPRKMAASEAQQVGAAMTYHNRRLAMMMYKIEDNSKENVNVLEDADYSAQHIPAPIIPPPPVAPTVKIEEKQVLPPEIEPKEKEEAKESAPIVPPVISAPAPKETVKEEVEKEQMSPTPPINRPIAPPPMPDMSGYGSVKKEDSKPSIPPAPKKSIEDLYG